MGNREELILVITSNHTFGQSLRQMLLDNGYSVTLAAGESSLSYSRAQDQPVLALVDRQSAGFETMRQHPVLQKIPLLAIQQPGSMCEDDDCANDLDTWADGWLCNQSHRQVLAQIRAVSRRSRYIETSTNCLQAGSIRVDLERHEVAVNNRFVELTLKEFNILTQFARTPNRVFTRQELLDRVWGENYELEEHALDVYIHSLRKKIEPNPSKPIFIVTVRKVGFKFIPA